MTDKPSLDNLRALPDGSLTQEEVGWICDEIERLRAEIERLREAP